MRKNLTFVILLLVAVAAHAAEVESRAQSTYLPQDFLEEIVRKEAWTEIVLKPFGGVRKGDIARIWAGGMIDRGGSDRPGINVTGPAGSGLKSLEPGAPPLALAPQPHLAYALLFKTDDGVPHSCNIPGKPMDIVLKEGGKLWVGFNDARGAFVDNHLGKGERHELDPLWVRVEVVRIVVD
jgi:hypothetical protein